MSTGLFTSECKQLIGTAVGFLGGRGGGDLLCRGVSYLPPSFHVVFENALSAAVFFFLGGGYTSSSQVSDENSWWGWVQCSDLMASL